MFKDEDRVMRKLIFIAALAVTPFMVTTVQAADTSTKITFAKDSYCGNFSGYLKNG